MRNAKMATKREREEAFNCELWTQLPIQIEEVTNYASELITYMYICTCFICMYEVKYIS